MTLAAELLARNEPGFQPICGMGICFECRREIDGVPHRRTCMPIAATGAKDCDREIVVVGAGPAGIAAACAARECGRARDTSPSPSAIPASCAISLSSSDI